MAKKKTKTKKKKGRSASSMMALVNDAGATAEAVTGAVVATKPPPPKVEPKRKSTCGVCLKPEQIIAMTDGDGAWEVLGHPDHIDRDVCFNCLAEYESREECALLVFDAMRKQLRKKDFAERDVEQAVHIAWRTFAVAFDHKALVKMSKKLKVKHPWLKGKKAK